MASLVLYGSAVADTTLTTACKMAAATGGTETSKTTTTNAPGTFAEITSKGLTVTGVSAIPATPTGNGWVYSPGAGTFALGNWSAAANIAFGFINPTGSTSTIRFFKYSSGAYTLIGSIAVATTSTAKAVRSFAATSMSSVTFASGDLLYIDLWMHDGGTDVGGDAPVIYISSSSTAGVANDLQVTTSNFTASGGGATHFSIFDGYGGFVS